ncbi:hypothetical protein EV182_005394, partial [Spiromyces aspiralis]
NECLQKALALQPLPSLNSSTILLDTSDPLCVDIDGFTLRSMEDWQSALAPFSTQQMFGVWTSRRLTQTFSHSAWIQGLKFKDSPAPGPCPVMAKQMSRHVPQAMHDFLRRCSEAATVRPESDRPALESAATHSGSRAAFPGFTSRYTLLESPPSALTALSDEDAGEGSLFRPPVNAHRATADACGGAAPMKRCISSDTHDEQPTKRMRLRGSPVGEPQPSLSLSSPRPYPVASAMAKDTSPAVAAAVRRGQADSYHARHRLYEEIEDLVTNIFDEDDKVKDSTDPPATLYYFQRLKHNFGSLFVLDKRFIRKLRTMLVHWNRICGTGAQHPLSTDDANRLVKLVSEVTASAEPISLKSILSTENLVGIAKGRGATMGQEAPSGGSTGDGREHACATYPKQIISELDNALSLLCLGLEAVVFITHIVSINSFEKKASPYVQPLLQC